MDKQKRHSRKKSGQNLPARGGPRDLFVLRPPDFEAAKEDKDRPKRILILTADVGFGHRRAAMALASALEEKYGERCAITVANPMSDRRTPGFLRKSGEEYDRIVRKMPEIYRLRYQISDNPVSVAVTESVITVSLFAVIQDIIREVRPEVVVSTHPYFMAPLGALSTLGIYTGIQMNVITDFTKVHKLWFNNAADMTFLPTEITLEEAREADLPETKLKITGIPVNPKLMQETRSKKEIRLEMGWEPDLPLVLVVGSKRVKGLIGALNVLNHIGFQFQMVIISGGDSKVYERLQAISWHKPVFIYNFVEDMSPFLSAADCIVTKAGGLIISEALVCGLPLLLVDITPGQEEGNADYVINHGAAQLAIKPLQIMEAMCHWLEHDGALLRQYAATAASIGKPQSAYDIASTVMAAAENGPQPVPEDRNARIPTLKELLSRSGINIEFLQ